MRLLIVEDEKEICDTVAKSLYDAGYEVDTCYDGEEALAGILTENYDLVVLDLNLPGMDGMEILKELWHENEETKVLILSARGQIADKVEALDAGANDYMEKPFHLQELEARIRSLTRRKFVQKDVCLESGEIKFDTVRREAYAKGEMVSLTRKENGILEYPEPITATVFPTLTNGGFAVIHPSSKALFIILSSIFLNPTGSFIVPKTHAFSHNPGHTVPVNSGKLFVWSNLSNASFHCPLYTKSFISGAAFPSGHPYSDVQNGTPQSMHLAACIFTFS